jgi:hypothetical protein
MNNKKKYIIITIFILILLLGFLCWHFLPVFNTQTITTENSGSQTSQIIQLTKQQELEILSATSDIPAIILSDAEKQKILNKTDINVKPVIFSDEEIQQILNKRN